MDKTGKTNLGCDVWVGDQVLFIQVQVCGSSRYRKPKLNFGSVTHITPKRVTVKINGFKDKCIVPYGNVYPI